MKSKLFNVVMTAANLHSAALQKVGFSKWAIRDYSPIHHLLVYIAFRLNMNI